MNEKIWEQIERPPAEDWERTPVSVRRYVDKLERVLLYYAERVDQLETRFLAQQRLVEQLSERVEQLEAQNRALEARNRELEAENRLLREKLSKNSSNSSLPPSSDPPGTAPRPPKATSRKKRGGQRGHRFSARPLVEPERCRSVTDLRPHSCSTCGFDLAGSDPAPARHQVVELPEIEPIVDEFRLHRLTCSRCGESTRASLPREARAGFGPNVVATIAYLATHLHASVRATRQALEELFGIEISTGAIILQRREASRHVGEPIAEAIAYVHLAEARTADETPWPVGSSDGMNPDERAGWLWVASTPRVAVFGVELSRSSDVAKALLGLESTGSVTTDRYSAYSWIREDRHQFCWSHLARDFKAIAGRAGPSAPIGVSLVKLTKRLFLAWHRFRDGTSSRRRWEATAERLRREVRVWLERGAALECAAGEKSVESLTRGTCRRLLEREGSLWVFVTRRGVEPTSNAAERLLRQAVLWRRVSQGSESAEGARFVARMLTVVETLRLQGRGVLAYLRDAITAGRAGRPAPSLLPSV